MITRLKIFTALLALQLLGQPAFSAGDSAGSEPPKCSNGKVWDKQAGKCVPKESRLDDESLYEAGRELAYSGHYEEAIDLLSRVSNRNDPRVLNYLGYANRKAGRMDVGLTYYRKALAIDPDYVLARSYMGQALLQSGDREGALTQLAEIRKRTGPAGVAYTQLAETIRTGRGY